MLPPSLRTGGETASGLVPRDRPDGPGATTGLAARSRPPNRLQPVLAKRREVEQQVDGVGQSCGELCLRIEHKFDSRVPPGRQLFPARVFARRWPYLAL